MAKEQNKEHEFKDLDDVMESDSNSNEDKEENNKKEENDKKSSKKQKQEKKRKNLNADYENATKSTRDKNKEKFSIWKMFKKHIMKPLIGFVVGMIVAIFLFGGSSSEDESEQVYEVDDSVSIEDKIDNVRSSQIDAIRKQFSALREDGADRNEEDKLAEINANAAKNLDPFLKEVMNLPFNPSEKELTSRTNKLKELSKGQDDEENFDKSAIDNLLKGNSASKELNQPGVKSGVTFASVMGVDKKNNNVYLTMTPFTTDDKTVNVLYLIKADSDGKFVTGTYIGYVQSSDKNRVKDTFSYLSNALKGDVNADQVNKAVEQDIKQANNKAKKETEKQEKEQQETQNKEKKEKEKKDNANEQKQKDDK